MKIYSKSPVRQFNSTAQLRKALGIVISQEFKLSIHVLVSYQSTMMLARSSYIFLLILFLSPVVSGQSISSLDKELIATLFRTQREQPSQVPSLLQARSDLITPRLWQQMEELAAAAFYSKAPENSLIFYELAKQIALHLREPKLLARTFYDIGRTHSGFSNFPQAIEAYLQSRKIYEEIGAQRDVIYLLSDLGALYFNLEDYAKAKECSEQSIKLAEQLKGSAAPVGAWPDEYGMAGALATLAEISLRDGDSAKALEYLQQSLALYQQLNGRGSFYNIYVADTYAAIGRVYTTISEHSQALLYLNKALEITKTLSNPDRMASLLNAIGFLYMEQEDYAQAEEQFNHSLKIYLAQKNARKASTVLSNLGVIEQRQLRYEQALERFRQSLDGAEAAQSKEMMIGAGAGIGVVLGAKGDYKAAIEALEKSLGLAKETGDQMRQAELLWRLAEVYSAMGDYSQGAALAETALARARALRLPKLSYLAMTTLGQAYAGQDKPDLAVKTLVQAVEQVERMREQVAGQEEELQLFFENKVSSYHTLIELLIKQNRPLEALLYAERAKGRVLLDVLRGGRANVTAALTPAEKAEAQRLNRNISELTELISREQKTARPNQSVLDSLYSRLDAARLNYQSFQNALYIAHPNLKIKQGYTAALTLQNVNAFARSNQSAYLEYVITDKKVYLFVLTKRQETPGFDLTTYTIATGAEELAGKITQFQRMMADRNPVFVGRAHQLYDLLVKPAAQQLRGVTTLCIIPDGVLWDVPFQALITPNDKYLLEDYALYYAPSLSILSEMARLNSSRTEQLRANIIAYGNPAIAGYGTSDDRNAMGTSALRPLPETETEVNSLNQIYGSARSKTFTGAEASEKSFKALAPPFRIIHLATHGILDNRHPLYSHLLLTKTNGDVENDGLLEAREIMNMNLRADLAVLSACETARGRVGAGEGVIGMSWAFFVAGCRTTVVSQWKVNSASTAQLMVNFHRQLKSETSQSPVTKANALRLAALELMKDRHYMHPFYWAGFVVVGSNK